MKYLQLSDIDCYRDAFELSNHIWVMVGKWGWFEKQTVGVQFVRAIDSISANIAEGFGRFTKKDKIKFYYYSFGSVKESLDWNQKSYARKLLSETEYKRVFSTLERLPREIHQLIKFTNDKLER